MLTRPYNSVTEHEEKVTAKLLAHNLYQLIPSNCPFFHASSAVDTAARRVDVNIFVFNGRAWTRSLFLNVALDFLPERASLLFWPENQFDAIRRTERVLGIDVTYNRDFDAERVEIAERRGFSEVILRVSDQHLVYRVSAPHRLNSQDPQRIYVRDQIEFRNFADAISRAKLENPSRAMLFNMASFQWMEQRFSHRIRRLRGAFHNWFLAPSSIARRIGLAPFPAGTCSLICDDDSKTTSLAYLTAQQKRTYPMFIQEFQDRLISYSS